MNCCPQPRDCNAKLCVECEGELDRDFHGAIPLVRQLSFEGIEVQMKKDNNPLLDESPESDSLCEAGSRTTGISYNSQHQTQQVIGGNLYSKTDCMSDSVLGSAEIELWEIFSAMKLREDKLYVFQDYKNTEQTSDDLGEIPDNWRQGICLWIHRCVAYLSNQNDFLASVMEATAVSYLDRFLASLPRESRFQEDTVLLTALTGVHLARCVLGQGGTLYSASHGHTPKPTTTLSYERLLQIVENTSIQPFQLRNMQRQMLCRLRFALFPPTLPEYLYCYIYFLREFSLQMTTYQEDAVCFYLDSQVCDYLEKQSHALALVALRTSFELSTMPQHTVAFCALGVCMEFAQHALSAEMSAVCHSFLENFGSTELNIDVRPFQEKYSHSHASNDESPNQTAYSNTRFIRIMLWKIMLEMPNTTFADSSQSASTKSSNFCPSPQSVANPLDQDFDNVESFVVWWERFLSSYKKSRFSLKRALSPQLQIKQELLIPNLDSDTQSNTSNSPIDNVLSTFSEQPLCQTLAPPRRKRSRQSH